MRHILVDIIRRLTTSKLQAILVLPFRKSGISGRNAFPMAGSSTEESSSEPSVTSNMFSTFTLLCAP